jgi:hypothetical protein
MKRRKFLTIAGIGSAVAALTSFKFISTSYEEAAVTIIEKELSFLKLEREGIEKFIADYSKTKNSGYRLAIRGYSFFGVKASQSGKVNQLVTGYLLSTNFFVNKMDEKREVKYVALYDPYARPCSHPFSHIHYA